jgi:hypothetical protein
MDDQERFNLEIENRGPLAKDSRKRVEDLLLALENSSSVVSQRSTHDPVAVLARELGVTPAELMEEASKHDPIASAAKRFGITPAEAAEMAEEMGF